MIRKFPKSDVRFIIFVICISLCYSICFTLSEFSDSPISGVRDALIIGLQWGAISFATFGLMYVLALSKLIFAIIFPLLTGFCTFLTYFRITLKATLTPMTIDLALVNDWQTNVQVASLELILYVTAALVLSIIIVHIRWKKVTYTKLAFGWLPLHPIIAFAIVTSVTHIQPLKRPLSERMPYSVYYNFKRYLDERKLIAENRSTFTENSVAMQDSVAVILIIGESLRSDHLQLNGYHRQTTPLLSAEKNLVSYTSVYTEPCYTHVSVPHILTRADSINPDIAYTEQSFVSIFKNAGFHTSWIANQESVDTYVYFMNECDTLIYSNSSKSLYTYDAWLDEDILPHLTQQLQLPHSKQLHILHAIGSHWWYNSHYTAEFEKFKPTIKSRVVSSNTQEEMINAYDNTIIYTDWFVSQVIETIRDKNAILLFISDHGESLGEDGYYIHGVDRPELHYPASFVWYSDKYKEQNPEFITKLRENRDKHWRTDYVFHSILDAARIESPYLQPNLSIFR